MDISKVIEQYPKIKENIDQLGTMLEDYNNAKSDVTKKLLTSAIENMLQLQHLKQNNIDV